jgi:Ca2+-transporting ATPase
MPPLTFAGLFGLEDVLREGVREAVETARQKGVKVVLISGDYRTTVAALAREAGIWKPGDMVVDGADIDRMGALSRSMLTVPTVFARVTPEHKLMIIEAYKKHGDIIAMTGDGVNDALSLVDADLGIAMGRIGTAVAKESADIILLDDNFSSIIAALEEGRGIYRAIERVLIYLFSTGLGELFVVIGSLIFALPLPLLPSQILWLNVVTDGLPVLALAFEPRMRGDGKPIAKDQNFIDSRSLVRTTIMGVVMAAGTLALFALGAGVDLAHATTIALTALAVYQWFNIYNCRSNDSSVTETKIFSNKSLNIAMIITVLLHCAALYAPFMQRILHTVPLSFTDWISVAFVALSVIAAEEIRKLVVRRKRERHAASEPVVSGV